MRIGSAPAMMRSDWPPLTLVMSSTAGHYVLVIASDALAGALIGTLVETLRLRAEFVRPDERPEDALVRVRPLAVILLEAAEDQAESDLFVVRARRGGVQLLLFGSAAKIDARMPWADERGIPAFALPDELDALQAALEGMVRPVERRPRVGDRRSAAIVTTGQADTLVFEDDAGRRWSVYDRRTTDRRKDMVERKFISESGEIHHCLIGSTDAKSLSVTSLSRQLEHALRG